MLKSIRAAWVLGIFVVCVAGSSWLAGGPSWAAGQQQAENQRPQSPPTFFREDWKLAGGLPNIHTPEEPEHAVVQGDVVNPNLEVRLYGDKSCPVAVNQPNNNDLSYVMTLLCPSNWAITLRDKNNDVDLTGLATIRWRTRVSGFRALHPIVKLADGTWLVGDKGDGSITDWRTSEINFSDLRWLRLDIDKVVTKGNFVANVDLSKVDEIGYVDLMPGSGHGPGGWSDVGAIEVYANPVKR